MLQKRVLVEAGCHAWPPCPCSRRWPDAAPSLCLLAPRPPLTCPLSPQFAMWVDAVIFVFSLEDEISFQTVYHYYSRMANYRNTSEIPLVLVGTQGEWHLRAGGAHEALAAEPSLASWPVFSETGPVCRRCKEEIISC